MMVIEYSKECMEPFLELHEACFALYQAIIEQYIKVGKCFFFLHPLVDGEILDYLRQIELENFIITTEFNLVNYSYIAIPKGLNLVTIDDGADLKVVRICMNYEEHEAKCEIDENLIEE